MNRVHELKTLPTYFEPVWLGVKTFEVRFDDRGYQTGDSLILREHNPRSRCRCPLPEETGTRIEHDPVMCDRYSGREVVATVGYVLATTPPRGGQPGFQGRGYVVLALIDGQRNDAVCSRLTSAPSPTLAPRPSPRAGDNTAVRFEGPILVTEVQLTATPSPEVVARAVAERQARR